MREFFSGWRRKIGLLTLVAALVLMGEWIRSLRTLDNAVVAFGKISFEFQSKSGIAEIMLHRMSYSHSSIFGIEQTRWQSYRHVPPPSADNPIYVVTIEHTTGPTEEWRYERTTEFCGLTFATGDQTYFGDRVETNVVAFPYWSMVIPLTAISAFLLISKPRNLIQKKIVEPVPAEGTGIMGKFFSGWNRKFSVAEVTVIIVTLAVLYSLLSEKPTWVSDGTIRIPVRVFVFDATNRRPISNAECFIFHASPILDANSLTKDHPAFDTFPMKEWPQSSRGTTDETGSTAIEHTFGTSASNKHPNARAHLMNEWVRVEADGFGGVVLPVGYDEGPTSEMKKDGEIVVSIGLFPVE